MSPITEVRVLVLALVPVSVSVRGVVVPLRAIAPALPNVRAPVPDESMVPPLAPSVNRRFVVSPTPVYCNVPPSNTRLAAALVACPMFPATPPFPIVAALKVPALIVVTPVYAFAPDNVSVPLPIFVSPPVVAALAPLIVRLVAAVVTSIELVVRLVNVKARLVATVAPVYCSVPPPSTRLAAPAPDWPMLLGLPPLASRFALNTPALIVVAPV